MGHIDCLYTLLRAQRTGGFARFLDLVYDDTRGREQITRWPGIEPHAVKPVAKLTGRDRLVVENIILRRNVRRVDTHVP